MHTKRMFLGVIVVCIAILCPIGAFAQQGTDCRRRKEPPKPGTLDLTGEWMDNSVNLKVKITQVGSEVQAVYIDASSKPAPYKCAYGSLPSSHYEGHHAVVLDDDFTGQLTKLNSTITGVVSICQSRTDTLSDNNGTTFLPSTTHSETSSSVVQGKLELTISDDGNSMTGTFEDPEKGTQKISFTRLSKPDTSPYYPAGVITTTATAKIYHEPTSGSSVAYTAPPGTRLIFEDVKLDAAGNPTWYKVVNGEGPAYSKNTGWIRATQITCNKPNTKDPGPVSLLNF